MASYWINSRFVDVIIHRTLRLRNFYRKQHHSAGQELSQTNAFTERSHNCGQITANDVGKRVKLYGWVQHTRFDNKIIAIRDSYGITQCIADESLLTRDFRHKSIHNESIVKISGIVRARPVDRKNEAQSTGQVEVIADEIDVVNPASKDLPILTRDTSGEHTIDNRLKYRYLDLRSKHMQRTLRARSKICQILRQKLVDLNFVECETPTLFRKTPGGANEFVVPTRLKGKYFALTQSPQQLKQLLMIGGLDRYFQICRCYRDESGRSDRQPEFTQLDIELSFTNQDLVMKLIDELMYDLFSKISQVLDRRFQIDSMFGRDLSIPRMTHAQSMELYGSDKPDTRFGWLIGSNGECGLEMTIPHQIDDHLIQNALDVALREKGINPSIFGINHKSIDGSTILTVDSDFLSGRELLGCMRRHLAEVLESQGKRVYEHQFKLLWVTDFPLFDRSDLTGELEPNHHPFTAPNEETVNLLEKDPLSVVGQHYDLILNGQEIAGGSIRIHDANLQRDIFTNLLGLKDETFAYFVEALKSGCPPHGGIAFGLDRLVSIILGQTSIREVLAFPKSTAGRDLVSNSPHEIDSNTKKLYGLT